MSLLAGLISSPSMSICGRSVISFARSTPFPMIFKSAVYTPAASSDSKIMNEHMSIVIVYTRSMEPDI